MTPPGKDVGWPPTSSPPPRCYILGTQHLEEKMTPPQGHGITSYFFWGGEGVSPGIPVLPVAPGTTEMSPLGLVGEAEATAAAGVLGARSGAGGDGVAGGFLGDAGGGGPGTGGQEQGQEQGQAREGHGVGMPSSPGVVFMGFGTGEVGFGRGGCCWMGFSDGRRLGLPRRLPAGTRGTQGMGGTRVKVGRGWGGWGLASWGECWRGENVEGDDAVTWNMAEWWGHGTWSDRDTGRN